MLAQAFFLISRTQTQLSRVARKPVFEVSSQVLQTQTSLQVTGLSISDIGFSELLLSRQPKQRLVSLLIYTFKLFWNVQKQIQIFSRRSYASATA